MHEVFLSGPSCFMQNPKAVAEMLAWEAYHEAWPDIPEEELKASAVSLPVGDAGDERLVLLHRRRVDEQQRVGGKEVSRFAKRVAIGLLVEYVSSDVSLEQGHSEGPAQRQEAG